MKQLIFEYQMKLSLSDYIREQQFQLRCVPITNKNQNVIESIYSIYPSDTINKFYDGFGNLVISGSAIDKHKEFRFTVKGVVEVDYANLYEEEAHPIFAYPTPLTTYEACMEDLLVEGEFYPSMMELMDKIHSNMTYTKGATTISTKAGEAYTNKAGVCQDYSHIMIAVAKHLGYKARYVAGMVYGEGETHAWVEVYHDGLWYPFDPTNNCILNDNYIVLAKGRDYHDCIIDKGIFVGNCEQKLEVNVSVK